MHQITSQEQWLKNLTVLQKFCVGLPQLRADNVEYIFNIKNKNIFFAKEEQV